MNQTVAKYIFESCPNIQKVAQLQRVNRAGKVFFRRTKNSKNYQWLQVLLETNDKRMLNQSTKRKIMPLLIDLHSTYYGNGMIDMRLLEIDHNLPRSNGGTNNLSNLFARTGTEHDQKHIAFGGKKAILNRKQKIRVSRENKQNAINQFPLVVDLLNYLENQLAKKVA